VDCDAGIDDALALLMLGQLHRRQRLRLEVVTTVGGNVPVEQTTRNACFVLDSDGDHQTPVVSGASQPLAGMGEHADGPMLHGPDGLGCLYEPGHRAPSKNGTAAQEIRRRLCAETENERQWILATGPLTNIAMALRTRLSVCRE